MRKIMVFSSEKENAECTLFHGEELYYEIDNDGNLTIGEWETDTAIGHTVYAHGTWTSIRLFENKPPK